MTGQDSEERLLVLMPNRRDAERIARVLCEAGHGCTVCATLPELCREITAGAGAALLTEEAILKDSDRCLESSLRDQPRWSSFPLIVLTAPGRETQHPSLETFPSITLVERPVRILTLRSVVQSALRHRRHQYEIRDILLRLKTAHEELASANRELENRVTDRTARLTEALHELEGFSYSIAHDMRAPLRSMRGFSRVVLEDYSEGLPEEGVAYLRRIEAAAERMDQLITDVLNYSRTLPADLRLEPVDVGRLIREVVASYPAFSGKAGHITIAGTFPIVQGNAAALTQVISNLLGNALKFVPSGKPPEVRVWAEISENGQTAKIFFKDNGIGIDPHYQKQIFGMFVRLHLPDTFEGTGIGLAIVRKAMDRMHGTVGLESAPGKGSTFWIELPKAPNPVVSSGVRNMHDYPTT